MIAPSTIRTLVVECASEACSVALFEADPGVDFAHSNLIANQHQVLGRGHAERLVPMIADLPGRGKAHRILVSLGPGSFTGVRIGIATARALGIAWQCDVFGYPTLAMVAACASQQAIAPVSVCMNGGHGEWFIQNFDQHLMPQDGVQSLPPPDAKLACKHARIAGNRAQELAQLFEENAGEEAIEATDLLPDASAARSIPASLLVETLSPIYGRAPDATLPQQRKPAA